MIVRPVRVAKLGLVLTLKRSIIWYPFVASAMLIVVISVIAPIVALIVITPVCEIAPVVATVIPTAVCVCNLRALHALHGLKYLQHLLLHRVDYRVRCCLDDQLGLVIGLLRYWE